jgi:hypothetical protein
LFRFAAAGLGSGGLNMSLSRLLKTLSLKGRFAIPAASSGRKIMRLVQLCRFMGKP